MNPFLHTNYNIFNASVPGSQPYVSEISKGAGDSRVRLLSSMGIKIPSTKDRHQP